ncbi:MAG: hypothetical protein Q8M09_08260 [Pseudomonadota bacterium]|nr:hypothetical protein [Pseudomonadota bacterium]MDP1904222.1 hypothetical protein [Pseudomonadota bacterium]
MDTLSVFTHPNQDGTFAVHYKWRQGEAKMPGRGGVVMVTLHQKHADDRSILAELGALHHLLCVEQVHGEKRLGNGITIEVSAGAIRKAVAKGALKQSDAGLTEKLHVALFSQFLATRFFEAQVVTAPAEKWTDEEVKISKDYAVNIDAPMTARLPSDLGDIIITRHALNRFVERFAAADEIKSGATLIDVPDFRWTRAWRTLGAILPKAEQVEIPTKERQRILKKYGPGVVALHHPDSQSIFIIKHDWYGLTMATAIRDSEYCKIVPKLPMYAGGRVVY